jgi:Fe2+ or Zn2+ uptake regulation protein
MTVHRVLGTFVSLGLVAKSCHPGSAARFDPKLRRHHHLVCLDCGRMIDVEDARLDHLPWPKVNPKEFQIKDYDVHFRGRCARCRQTATGVPRTRTKAGRASMGAKATLEQTDPQRKEHHHE